MRLIPIVLLAAALSGCAEFRTKIDQLRNVYTEVTTASVTPTQIVVVANAFDAVYGTGIQYLNYCKSNLSMSVCSAGNRRAVIKWSRIGRAARNQLETYLSTKGNAPSALYNALVAAVNALNATPAANGAPH